MPIEIERKYLDADLSEVRERLKAMGAQSNGPHFERNIIFDIDDGSLAREGKLLRLRVCEWPGGHKCFLTVKSSIDRRNDDTTESCKMREELEIEVLSSEKMNAILCKLGYSPVANYEKVREEWLLRWPEGTDAESAEMSVDLDILPFCQVIEIEGDPDKMDGLAQKLGLDKHKISTKTYHELYKRWRVANNLPPAPSFVFETQQKKQLRSLLGLSR